MSGTWRTNDSLEQTKQFASEALETFNPTKYADQLAAIPGAEGVRHEMLQAGIEFFQRYEKEVADDPALATDWALAQSKLGMLNEKLDNKKEAVDGPHEGDGSVARASCARSFECRKCPQSGAGTE